jgi:diphosphate-dependent phosphofructokinase
MADARAQVCGCPKTIDGDLKNEYIPISFGFDTAVKTFSEEVGNVALDTLAGQKYYHFIRLMGRAASNIALECALQTRPNLCLISEEVEAQARNLLQITNEVADMVSQPSCTETLLEGLGGVHECVNVVDDCVYPRMQ